MSDKAEFLLGTSVEDSSSNESIELIVDKSKEQDKSEITSNNNIYDFDLETLKDKPWLKPGADITDYFNYGFTEKSWKKYCEMQRDNKAFVEKVSDQFDSRMDDRQTQTNYGRNYDDRDRQESMYQDRRQYDRGPNQYNDIKMNDRYQRQGYNDSRYYKDNDDSHRRDNRRRY